MKPIAVAPLALCRRRAGAGATGRQPTEIVIGTAQDLSGPIVGFPSRP